MVLLLMFDALPLHFWLHLRSTSSSLGLKVGSAHVNSAIENAVKERK